MGSVVDVLGRDPAHLPAGAGPRRRLARVLPNVLMRRSPVDLDDETCRRPAQVGLLAGDADVEPRQRSARGAQDLDCPDLSSAASPLERESGVSRHRDGQPAAAAPTPEPAECISQGVERDDLEPHGLAHRAGQCPIAHDPGQVEQRAGNRGDADAAYGRPLSRERRAPMHDHVAVTARAATPRPSDDLEAAGQRPKAPRRGPACVAQDAVRGRERRAHPSPPLVVLEDGWESEHTLFDGHQPARGEAVGDRGIAESELHQLPARDPVELPSGQLDHPSVPHTSLRPLVRDVRPHAPAHHPARARGPRLKVPKDPAGIVSRPQTAIS